MRLSAEAELPQIHLSAGNLLITREASVVVTVLGSCVAVTMFEPQSSLAAICHVMLAEPKASETVRAGDPKRFRYAAQAVPAMIGAYREAGVRPAAVEVKMFGGANVIGDPDATDPHWIGGANVTVARRLLEAAGFFVVAENSGGRRGRKILFNTGTGEVLHKYLHTFRR